MALSKAVQITKLALVVSLGVFLSACAAKPQVTPLMATRPELPQAKNFSAADASGFSDNIARASVEPSMIRSDAPNDYTVVRGDTLWDISTRFLNQPWLWTSIWEANPQIQNPNLIYPGDRLSLEYIDGVPFFMFSQNGGEPTMGAAFTNNLDENGDPIVTFPNHRAKIGPIIRSQSLETAIPTIPGSAIKQFLIHPQVVDSDTVDMAPYVVGNRDGRLISSVGSEIYVRGITNRQQSNYGIYRLSNELRDPDTGAVLGQEITHVADAQVQGIGDPATLKITHNTMETKSGDILLPRLVEDSTHRWVPRLPKLNGEGKIISLFESISQSGRNQVVVLNIGRSGNIEKGDILAIESQGAKIVDKRANSRSKDLQLPGSRTGVVMVFKTFEKVSYALVMESTRPVNVNDIFSGI